MRYCRSCKATFLSMINCPRDGTVLTVEGGDPLLGEVLGERYRILERISAGGMGVMLYNSGDVAGCAQLYLDTATGLEAGLHPGARNAPLKRLFNAALTKAKGAEPNDAAWALRHAFDAVLEAWRIVPNPLGVSAVKRERT